MRHTSWGHAAAYAGRASCTRCGGQDPYHSTCVMWVNRHNSSVPDLVVAAHNAVMCTRAPHQDCHVTWRPCVCRAAAFSTPAQQAPEPHPGEQCTSLLHIPLGYGTLGQVHPLCTASSMPQTQEQLSLPFTKQILPCKATAQTCTFCAEHNHWSSDAHYCTGTCIRPRFC